MKTLIEITKTRPNSDPKYAYTKGEKLWLDSYTAHQLVIAKVAIYVNPQKKSPIFRSPLS